MSKCQIKLPGFLIDRGCPTEGFPFAKLSIDFERFVEAGKKENIFNLEPWDFFAFWLGQDLKLYPQLALSATQLS